jgi:DNA polymerase-1
MPHTFYIIDGHAQIYRAFFAPFRELSSPSGEPTKATYGFMQMLLSLVEQRKPDYLAMVIDAGGDEGVFRKQIDPQYKANRAPRPADLIVQEQRILQLVEQAGVPIFAEPGVEADDVIATMASQLQDRDFDVVIVSRDKDLRQLIGPSVRLYDVQGNKEIDAQRMLADCGYAPAQAVDIQTLTGDSTDNVRGIPGVGEKTAARLISTYGSIEGIYQHLDELTPKLRQNLQEFKSQLDQTRQLVTLRRDVPMRFDPQTCRCRGLNVAVLRQSLADLGFHSLVKRLASLPAEDHGKPAPSLEFASGLFGDPPAAAAAPATTGGPATHANSQLDYRLVNTPELLSAFLSELGRQGHFAFDTETDQLDPMRCGLVGMSFSWQEGTGWYLPVRGPLGATVLDKQRTLEAVRPILEDPQISKVGHNVKYDLLVLRQTGVRVRGVVMDSMIAAFLLDAGRSRYGIDPLALDLLGYRKIATSEMLGTGKNQTSMDRVPLETITRYAAEDADIAWRLAQLLGKRLDGIPALRQLHDELETPLIEVLVDMEETGVSVDPAILQEQSQVLGTRIEDLRRRIMEAACAEFNPDSPRQLADVLFNKLGLRIIKRTKTGPSTDVEVLEKLALEHPCPKLLLEYRSLVKLKNTYLDNLTEFINPRTGRIHASFNPIGAQTGRLSCSDPNLQNIPIRSDEGRRIRLAFVPQDRQRDVLLTADYSQIELRMLAHFTGEPALLAAFAADEDVHAAVAAEVFGVPLAKVSKEQRAQAKIVNFGIIYGVSAAGLARRIEGLSTSAAEQLIAAYHKRFPSIEAFLRQCVEQAHRQGFVQTLLGRRRPIPDIASPVPNIRNGAERMAINSVVQGSAADLIKRAMLNVHRQLAAQKRPSRMLLQVHDELVFETPRDAVEADARLIRQEMVGAMELRVPLKVDIAWGRNWDEGKG